MVDKLKLHYNERIKHEIEGSPSRDYKQFLEEFKQSSLGFYEKACSFCEQFGLSPDPKTSKKISDAADFCNLNITPKGAFSLAILGPLTVTLFLLVFAFLLSDNFLLIVFLLSGMGAIVPLMKMPYYIADDFRLKASNQMVLSVFYVVTYLRHTSNLERAVEFAGEHLAPPMNTEFRKILWDVEAGNFMSISESLEHFLDKWKDTNPEFVDAMHVVQSSLLEGTEKRRLETLEKSLNLILDETYEKMLHFAHNLQSPITTLHMLGIILPILGLVILPLMTSFLGDTVKWYQIAVVYNLVLPVMVLLMGFKILSKRPSGYGDTPMSSKEIDSALKEKAKIGKINLGVSPAVVGWVVGIILVLVGFIPIFMTAFEAEDFGFGDETDLTLCGKQMCFLEYRELENGDKYGPFGVPSSLMSLLVVLGLGLGIGLYFSMRTGNVMKIYNKSKELEREFSSSLFQLGNRLGDNLPAEIATLKVAEGLPDSASGNFFKIVSINIQKLGMSIKEAVFDSNVGAIVYYPSSLIESSMKVLIESAKKGPLIASNALINISRYIKEMHKVEERLKDLMAEVISSMKSQINFLTPIISGVVVGITSMISGIIGTLGANVGAVTEEAASNSAAGFSPDMLAGFFEGGFPTFYFQMIVGIYVVQIIIILTLIVSNLQNGSDTIKRNYMLGKNLTKSVTTYVIISGLLIFAFQYLVTAIIPPLA